MIFNHNNNNQILNMLNVIVNAIQSMIINDSQIQMLNILQKLDNDGEAISYKKTKNNIENTQFISLIILKMLIVLLKPLKY